MLGCQSEQDLLANAALQKNLCMDAFVCCICMYESRHIHNQSVRVGRRQPWMSVLTFCLVLRQGLFAIRHCSSGLSRPKSIQGSHHRSIGATSTHACCVAFIWAPGVQMQVLMLIQTMFDSLSGSPSPC